MLKWRRRERRREVYKRREGGRRRWGEPLRSWVLLCSSEVGHVIIGAYSQKHTNSGKDMFKLRPPRCLDVMGLFSPAAVRYCAHSPLDRGRIRSDIINHITWKQR